MLSTEDKAILDFERSWAALAGPKDLVIELTLGLDTARYYERLRRLAGDADAIAYDPLTVRRVRRMIETPTRDEMAV